MTFEETQELDNAWSFAERKLFAEWVRKCSLVQAQFAIYPNQGRRSEELLVTIPAELLHAIAAPGGGRVAIVIGAGCSVEAPTEMPLAAPLAHDVERRLVLEGVLQQGQCDDPWDLAALATLVWQKTGTQAALVHRFPLDRMRLAKPNLGYRLLVALMAEGAVTHVLSLNFDLAVQNAATELGSDISIIDAAGQAVPVRAAVVHLHGNANSDSEQLVLRLEEIDQGWFGQWEQIVVQQILGAPILLFAGLGSAAPVLTSTIGLIQKALDGGKALYQADIGDYDANHFAEQLNIAPEHYIQGSWCTVLAKLAERVAAEQAHALAVNGTSLLKENGVPDADRDRFNVLAGRFQNLSLLALGKLRAFANLDVRRVYRPHEQRDDELIAEPMVKLAQLAEHLGFEAQPTSGGTWRLMRNGQLVAQLVLASGGGVRRSAALEPLLKRVCDYIDENSPMGLDFVLVGGLAAGEHHLQHVDIIADQNPADIIGGPSTPPLISANDPEFVRRVGILLNAA